MEGSADRLNDPASRERGRVLIVDDDATTRATLATTLREKGYRTASCPDPLKGLGRLAKFSPDVIVTGVRMRGMSGLQFIERARQMSAEPVFIVISESASVPEAIEAVKAGAEHYVELPLELSGMLSLVEQAARKVRRQRELRRVRSCDAPTALSRILGNHPSLQHLRKAIEQVAPSNVTVLVTGETGTGKELAAAAIHEQSERRDRPFVKLNCAALAESILESELFGHEKGSFTGAICRREGRFMQADGGTLFLDEVSEIPMGTQVKLLRFLQEREFERVGGNETLRIDVRLVAACNQDLRAAVAAGKFREDLFYRLNIVHLEVPSLRQRSTDIPELADHFVLRLAESHGKRIDGITPEAMELLSRHDWPGNVRELQNILERAIVMATDSWIRPEHVTPVLNDRSSNGLEAMIPGSTLKEIERVAILKSLEAVGGSTSRAAALLDISPRKIQYRLREYGLRGSELREAAAS